MSAGNSLPPRWQFGFAVLLIVVVNVGSGLLTMSANAATVWILLPWLITMLLVILCFAIIGRLPPIVDWRGVLIDQRNKMSLSQLQLVVWSILVISAVVTDGVLNAVWGRRNPLSLNIPNELWIVLGLSTASFVAAPMVLGTKGKDLDTNSPDELAWRDIFYGDDTGNADQVDFSKVQQFFFTVVLVVVYAASIGKTLATAIPSCSQLVFPKLDPGFVGIMAVSQTSYIAYKAIRQNKTDSEKT